MAASSSSAASAGAAAASPSSQQQQQQQQSPPPPQRPAAALQHHAVNSLAPSQTIRAGSGGSRTTQQRQQQGQGGVASTTSPALPTPSPAPGAASASSNGVDGASNAANAAPSPGNANNRRRNNNNRNRNRKKNKQNQQKSPGEGGNEKQKQEEGEADGDSPSGGGRGKKSEDVNGDESRKGQGVDGQDGKGDGKKNKNNKRRNRNSNKKKNKGSPSWRDHVPEGTVDPITLDSIRSLRYPPFALVAAEPYTPVDVWPIPDAQEAESRVAVEMPEETEEDRQRRIIEEQWGDKLKLAAAAEDDESGGEKEGKMPAAAAAGDLDTKPAPRERKEEKQRHYHLYDGRALAYYMVSQLQFIDPLNRRDLTRDELVNLDRYLRRHGFKKLNVVEAYDAKGVTLSTAGAAANTAAGRAAILQQEASVLLGALFGGGVVVSTPADEQQQRSSGGGNNINDGNDLRSQYRRQQQLQQASTSQGRGRTAQRHRSPFAQDDIGIYGGAGVMVIDDDMNPGLRGSAPAFVPGGGGSGGANTLWSASHIRGAHGGGHEAGVQAHEFPSLSAAVPRPAAASSAAQQQQRNQSSASSNNSKKKAPPPPKTLSLIGGLVKKTDPEELQRQWEAREEARRKALLSTMTFGSNLAASMDMQQDPPLGDGGIPASITTVKDNAPTEGQLQRNKALADALGVEPATARLNSGWARPVDGKAQLDEFGNELNAVIYPDSLIVQARERMAPLLKLEKKWKAFLLDDTAASLPLNPMDRPLRAFVHMYSDFWKLHTESFDAEPKRYIHCVKLRDTGAPHPLLSDAARNWRGPKPILASTTSAHTSAASATSASSDHSLLQTAGQSTRGREIPAAPQRQPLPLKPRTANLSVDHESGLLPSAAYAGSAATAIGGAPTRIMTEAAAANSRFESLSSGRERPKLYLQKRSVPLEMPRYEPPDKSGFDVAEELERSKKDAEAKARKEREKMERRQRVLEAAFASDDEEEHGQRTAGDSDSEWEEQEAAYAGSSDEE